MAKKDVSIFFWGGGAVWDPAYKIKMLPFRSNLFQTHSGDTTMKDETVI